MNQRPRLTIILVFSFVLAVAVAACSTSKSRPSTGTAGQAGVAGAAGQAGVAGVAGGVAGGNATGTAGSGGAGAGGASATGVAGSAGGAGAGGATAGAGGAVADGAAGSPVDAAADASASVGTGCKAATVCYDFEECATPKGWTVPNGEGNQGAGMTLVDNVMPHSGTCSLHMKDFSGDQPQHAYLANLPANFGPVLWGRAWVFTTSAPSQHGALVKARYSIPNKSDLDWYEVGYELKNYNGQWHNPLPPSGLPEWILRSSTPIGINRWQCVEWLFDAQNGDMPQAADPRIWVDGQEITFGPGLQYNGDGTNTIPQRPTTPRGNNFVSIEVGLTMYHQIDEKTNIYLDELAFGKTRVGCAP